MSKQLLHTYQSSVVIAGLNDHAFALIKGNNNNNETTNVYELMIAKSNVDDNDIEEITTKKQQQQQKNKKKKKSPKHDTTTTQEANNTSSNNPNEIQSVCCTQINNMIWLAVSREDKSLSLYNILSEEVADTSNVEEDGNSTRVYPNIVYKLPKRARCLAFSSVLPSSSKDATSNNNNNECHVIIVGDLSGDAIAFPIPQVTSAQTSTSISTTTSTTKRKLLLGHTASMLTALNVVPTSTTTSSPPINNLNKQKQQFILTADRDEKIRISHFPQTYNVHGYLLGHSSFISTMDAILTTATANNNCSSSATTGKEEEEGSSSRALCVTGGGDGTVRLWDYETCKEIGMLPIVIKKCSTTAAAEEEDCEDNIEEEEDVNDGE